MNIYAQLGNISSPAVRDALTRKCQVCGVQKGKLCENTILGGYPLDGRLVHFARVETAK